MKNLFCLLMLGLVVTTVNAEARSIIAAQTAEFYQVNFKTDSGLKFVRGAVKVDYVEEKISVSLVSENTCPPNAFCVQGPLFRKFEAALISRERDACGVNHYRAYKNDIPVDGSEVKIAVADMTHMICRFYPEAPIVVELTSKFINRMTGKAVIQKGKMYAKSFQATASGL